MVENFERKTKSSFMIYTNFESTVVAEKIGKQNPDKSYTNKYKKDVACIYDRNLVWVDDKLSKPFESFLEKDAVYNFKSIIRESKYCTNMMKKLVMIEDDEYFENSTKFWICDHVFAEGDVKIIVMSLKNIQALHRETVIPTLN